MKEIDETDYNERFRPLKDTKDLVERFHEKMFSKEEAEEILEKLDNDLTASEVETKSWIIHSKKRLYLAFGRNPKMFFRESAIQDYQQATVYCELMELLDSGEMNREPRNLSRFSTEHDIHRKTATEWSKQRKKPRLIRDLEEYGQKYLEKPNLKTLTSETNKNCIRLSSVNESTVEKIQNMFRETETRLFVIDTSDSKEILENNFPESLKIKMESEPGFTYQFGQTKTRFIIWKEDTQSVNLNRAYQNQYYYFLEPSVPITFVRKAIDKLGLDGNIAETDSDFRSVVQQLTTKNGIEYMRGNRIRISGSTMNLLSDILGSSLGDFEGLIEKVAGNNGHGGIHNPIFLDGQEFEIVLAGMLGVVVSDCHVRSEGSTGYFESNLGRINQFRNLISQFGEINWDSAVEQIKGSYTLWIPSVISDIVRLSGIPSGDRTILNYGLPSGYNNWSSEAKQEYMKQMLAEESWIGPDGRIQWSRTNALYAGSKTTEYNFETQLSTNAIRFLKESRRMKSLKKKEGYERIREKYITMGRLKRLAENPDNKSSITANEILGVIMNNRNRLLDDEVKIMKSFGVKISVNPSRISYHENSGRITITWGADVQRRDSKIRCALAFPPNHPEKIKNTRTFLSNQSKQELLEIKEKLGKSI